MPVRKVSDGQCTNCEIAWAAGFFDGEGSTGCSWREKKRDRQLRLSISQVNKDNLLRFQNATGNLGHILGPYQRPGRKPIWAYRIDTAKGVKAIIGILWPFLSKEKRQQATVALDLFESLGKKYNLTRNRPYGERVDRVSINCAVCGKPVRKIVSYLKRGVAMHCSKSCAGKHAATTKWGGITNACA